MEVLYGKLLSIAVEDFSTFTKRGYSLSKDVDLNRKYTYYLFAQFFAQLEHIRMKSQYSSIARIKKGRDLLKFVETFESRKFRLVDRSIQRMIGVIVAALINHFDPNSRIVRNREIYKNKLTDKSKIIIRKALLVSYLPFIRKKERYY